MPVTAPLRSRGRRSVEARPAPPGVRRRPARTGNLTTSTTASTLAALFDETPVDEAPITVAVPPAVEPLPTRRPSIGRGGRAVAHSTDTASDQDEAPTPPHQQLELALTDLAEVLAVYPYRAAMPACDHCVSEADRRALGRSPSEIPGPVLDRFAAKALITWGEVVDFKRLLPEIITRTCEGRLGPPPALVGARLRRADWRSWPAAETPAVRRTLRAAWITALSASPQPGQAPVGRLLGLLATAEEDLVPYLDEWEDRLGAPGDPATRLAAVLHLADVLGPLADGGRRHLAQSLPLARRGTVGQIDQWLRQPGVVQRLAHAAESLRITPHHARMSRGREGLARLRTDR